MNDYMIMTDGAADIPAEKMDDKNLIVIPMIFKIKDIAYEHYQDFRDMGSDEFYSGMKRGSLPAPEPIKKEKYIEEFDRISYISAYREDFRKAARLQMKRQRSSGVNIRKQR